MPLDPISVGTIPNDNTGTPLRDAWIKANAMFVELFAAVAAKADNAEMNALLAVLTQTDADTATALAGKANAADLALKANTDEVPHFSVPQAITLLQKLQLGANTGLYVTLPFEVLSPAIDIVGDYVFELPRFPRNFICQDATLAATLYTPGADAITVLAELNHSDLPKLAETPNIALGATGLVAMSVVVAERRISAGTPVKLTFTATNSGPYVGSGFGLTLWLRGAWES